MLRAVAACLIITASTAAAPPKVETQAAFLQNLDSPLAATRQDVSLGEFLQQLCASRHLAILLDRRIDPEQRLDVAINSPRAEDGLRELVKPLGLDIKVAGDTVLVGPADSMAQLRTRLALADQQYRTQIQSVRPPPLEVLQRRTIHWEEATSPRELLQNLASRAKVTLSNPNKLPHDLWATGAFGYANLNEALVLIANQFDLDVNWIDPATVEFVPANPNPVLTRTYPVPANDSAALLLRLADERLKVELDKGKLTLSGTAEDHERLEQILSNRPARSPVRPSRTGTPTTRTYTLRVVDAPFSGLIKTLQGQGIEVKFDPAQLKAAGIDLEQRISLDLQGATLAELLSAACKPVGLEFRVESGRIELLPPKSVSEPNL